MVPFGFLALAAGTLILIFGLTETSDSWVDALKLWWTHYRKQSSSLIKRLVIYLDNGPNNSGSRTQFLKRIVQFVDWSGVEVHLLYYPPYHSKYNPVERCWSSLEKKWRGLLLHCVSFVLQCARRMTWQAKHPEVYELAGNHYPNGVKLTRKEMRPWEARLERSKTLPKYDITIKPLNSQRPVS